MNVLLVDDQKAIVESLKQGIRWERIPVEKVYTACSAKEAKMVLRNFDIDVLVTDIEMPEEDGLSLFRWVKENTPDVEGVFLTSHADFEYARLAMHMGGFDYILQPARYEDVEQVLKKLQGKLKKQRKMQDLETTTAFLREQRSALLDGLLLKIQLGKKGEANQLYESFPNMLQDQPHKVLLVPVLVQVVRWQGIGEIWNEKLMRFMLCNVMEELFEATNGIAVVSSLDRDTYWIVLMLDEQVGDFSFFRQRIDDFHRFIEANMEFRMALYPGGDQQAGSFSHSYEVLTRSMTENRSRKPGVFWTQESSERRSGEADVVEEAKGYIARNLNKKISRGEVAGYVHLNETYFSRLFRQQTGLTFKDYLLMEKMEHAKELLRDSKLSISIIASKVGSDNFSHFCKMFKKINGQTPQEYRKSQTG